MIVNPLLGKTGRLGNQLWEIASTVGIAANRMEPVKFSYWEYTDYFSVNPKVFCEPGETPIGTSVYDLPEVQRLGQYAPYLQDLSFFEDIAPNIRLAFEPSTLAEEELARPDLREFWELPEPKLALHIRRGDNATSGQRNERGFHPLRPMSYYADALVSLENTGSIVVFSDDIPWCRANLISLKGRTDIYFFEGGPGRARECEDRYMVEPARDWIDLLAMATCDQFILSNSTYSWWAAFLSGVDGANIRYPDASVWFGPKLQDIDASLMFPLDWVPILHEQQV